jgi:hypothetical protein
MDPGMVRLRGSFDRFASVCVTLCALAGCGPAQDPLESDTDASVEGGRDPVLEGGGGIPDSPNGPSLCPVGECNYQSQTGCASDAGNACQPYPHDGGVAPTCAPAGAGVAGQACASWLDCLPGLLCAAGKCRRICCGGDYTACPPGEHCYSPLLVLVGDAAVASGAMLCMPAGSCDVFSGKPCPAGQACHIVDPTGAVACVPDGTGKAGDPCPCASGLTCVGDQCRRLCRAIAGGGEPYCSLDEVCVHYDRDPDGVGECCPYAP